MECKRFEDVPGPMSRFGYGHFPENFSVVSSIDWYKSIRVLVDWIFDKNINPKLFIVMLFRHWGSYLLIICSRLKRCPILLIALVRPSSPQRRITRL